MQVWVSCSEGRTTAREPHALGGDQCGEQRGPDLEKSRKNGTKIMDEGSKSAGLYRQKKE